MKNQYHYKTPIGMLRIEEEDGAISGLHISDGKSREADCETELLKRAYQQLTEYFAGKRKVFDLPLVMHGTDFQKTVWQALQTIPYGETFSYKELAGKIGNPKASRAVGGANNKNPLMILVPCHRVIGANGSLVGYAGGLQAKEFLLKLESETD